MEGIDPLTSLGAHDKMGIAIRACSSMVEQWPFKPLVESSSLSTLTFLKTTISADYKLQDLTVEIGRDYFKHLMNRN